MSKKPKKTTRYVDPEEVIRIVRETRLKAESVNEKSEECLLGKCKHVEHKPPRTSGAKESIQRRPRGILPSLENGVRSLEDYE